MLEQGMEETEREVDHDHFTYSSNLAIEAPGFCSPLVYDCTLVRNVMTKLDQSR
ncbi:hypothetical protein AXX17_AT1G33110 [Arabidopsis thaliana]|uniref:Uncharacterized protein n=1 Tax=Arabidopsis thaliana TaxID=3702 RepID=A0A178W6Q1_ARATH|nr:hypothetical protein AXX17_AT1G33110 [Arabidopsis thaliana]